MTERRITRGWISTPSRPCRSPKWPTDDSALFLWAINSMLPEAIEVIGAWGFTYKTVAFTWIKTNAKSPGFFTGLGYWTRCNPEQCLLATRGRPAPAASRCAATDRLAAA